jgi:hypothetical protein
MAPEYQTMNDGCEGDSDGLAAALDGAVLVWENYDSEGYGHHSANAIFRLPDGRVIHAECGGCSCEGSGSWSFEDSIEAAARLVPEWNRNGLVRA